MKRHGKFKLNRNKTFVKFDVKTHIIIAIKCYDPAQSVKMYEDGKLMYSHILIPSDDKMEFILKPNTEYRFDVAKPEEGKITLHYYKMES